MKAITTASSARATVRSTIPRAATARGRRRSICTSRRTTSFPTPRSKSADVSRLHFPGSQLMSGPSTYNPQNPALKWIEQRLPIGGLIHSSFIAYPTPRNLNYWWTFIAVYIHMFRGLYYGSYKAPREILWFLGVIIYLLMMATGFMCYVLPWGQMSFWGATVITNLFSAIPYVGDSIVTLLWGGYSVGHPTQHSC